jgi:hypothetical protein
MCKFMGLRLEAEVKIHSDKFGQFTVSRKIGRSSWNARHSPGWIFPREEVFPHCPLTDEFIHVDRRALPGG